MTRSIAAVSDGLCHDSAYALFSSRVIEEWLEDAAPARVNVIYVSDGAASHFKNRYRLYELSQSSYKGATRHFTGIGHGKSACDGIGGTVRHHATTHNFSSRERSAIINLEDTAMRLSPSLERIHLLRLRTEDLFDLLRSEKRGATKCPDAEYEVLMFGDVTDRRLEDGEP